MTNIQFSCRSASSKFCNNASTQNNLLATFGRGIFNDICLLCHEDHGPNSEFEAGFHPLLSPCTGSLDGQSAWPFSVQRLSPFDFVSRPRLDSLRNKFFEHRRRCYSERISPRFALCLFSFSQHWPSEALLHAKSQSIIAGSLIDIGFGA